MRPTSRVASGEETQIACRTAESAAGCDQKKIAEKVKSIQFLRLWQGTRQEVMPRTNRLTSGPTTRAMGMPMMQPTPKARNPGKNKARGQSDINRSHKERHHKPHHECHEQSEQQRGVFARNFCIVTDTIYFSTLCSRCTRCARIFLRCVSHSFINDSGDKRR